MPVASAETERGSTVQDPIAPKAAMSRCIARCRSIRSGARDGRFSDGRPARNTLVRRSSSNFPPNTTRPVGTRNLLLSRILAGRGHRAGGRRRASPLRRQCLPERCHRRARTLMIVHQEQVGGEDSARRSRCRRRSSRAAGGHRRRFDRRTTRGGDVDPTSRPAQESRSDDGTHRLRPRPRSPRRRSGHLAVSSFPFSSGYCGVDHPRAARIPRPTL